MIGIVLNGIIGQTLGLFSVASVILTLYVAFWAFAIGSIVLVLVSIRVVGISVGHFVSNQ
jgi:hypothetical protein